MFISLKVENAEMLPEGSRADFRSAEGDFEIGRQSSGWTLPDPDKIVSSRHCRITYHGGSFWLRDLSRNGTYVNGSRERLAAPYQLRHGDRLRIGRYIVHVALDDAAPVDRPEARREYPDPGFQQPFQGQAPATAGEKQPLARGDARVDVAARHDNSAPAAPFSFDNDPFLARAGHVPAQGPVRQEQSWQATPRAAPGPSRPAMSSDNLLRHVADAAGIPPETLLQRDHREVASEIGTILRLVAEELATLLKARAAAKGMVKSTHRTMIGGVDNNPLKFVPSTEEMLEIMFSRRRPGYMDAVRSVEDAFRDLKTHEMATYSAMQTALARLLEDISPATIEKKLAPSSFMSKKARAWDALLAAWAAREEVHENGMLDVFLSYFSEAYADASKER